MQVLLLPGTYDLLNLGDLAMLEVCMQRLRALWPDAKVHVLTHKPDDLLRHISGVTPVLLKGRNRWLKIRSLPRFLFPDAPERCRQQFPVTLRNVWKLGILAAPPQFRMVKPFVSAMFNADLVLMAGCGVITDSFHFNALRIMDMFAVAAKCGIPTAMTSQGIGPFTRPELLAGAQAMLPRVQRVFAREPLHTPRWLHAANFPSERVRITGDDAVALAFAAAPREMGNSLGVNLRLSGYSGMDAGFARFLGGVLTRKAETLKAELCGIPILTGQGANGDVISLQQVLPNHPGVAVEASGIVSTRQLAAQVARCRAVVTGSYHAGVFALSQGIPVVALAASAYYEEKFTGLAAQFGHGCVVLDPSAPAFSDALERALENFWCAAPELRPKLLAAAEKQVQSGIEAYASLTDLLGKR